MAKTSDHRVIAKNRRAHYNYSIEDKFEAGVVLLGSEVKSLRTGKANINDAYADEENGEIFLINSYIAPYKHAHQFNHPDRRKRKLLMHKTQIKRLIGKLQTKGMTLVPLSLYFNNKNMVKVELGLAKGKKTHDKRETEKKREWERQKSRALREKN